MMRMVKCNYTSVSLLYFLFWGVNQDEHLVDLGKLKSYVVFPSIMILKTMQKNMPKNPIVEFKCLINKCIQNKRKLGVIPMKMAELGSPKICLSHKNNRRLGKKQLTFSELWKLTKELLQHKKHSLKKNVSILERTNPFPIACSPYQWQPWGITADMSDTKGGKME